MNRDSLIWLAILLGVIIIASTASCLVGYVFPSVLQSARSTPTPTLPLPTLNEMHRTAELATVKYALSTEVSGVSIPQDFRQSLGIKEEILLIAYGEVAAGFDLSKLDSDAFWVDGSRVQLHLPAPQILYVRLDNEQTHVVYYDKSWFVERDLDLEGRTRQQAEALIYQAALESDILSRASEYGQLAFSEWLYSMGYSEVQVIVN